MANIRFLERLKAVQRGEDRSGFNDINAVLRSVVAHVGKLLNTRKGSCVLDDEFGIPDFTSIGVSYSRDDIPQIEREIAQFVERCEPRLSGVKVTYAPDPAEPFSVNFILDAGLIIAANETLPIKLMTRINPSGKVSVSD